jgi:hypothetical protein
MMALLQLGIGFSSGLQMNWYYVSALLVLLGLSIDCLSLYVSVKRIYFRGGASGIPIVGLLIYTLVFLWYDGFFLFSRAVDFIILLVVHITIHFFIPAGLKKVLD